MKYYKTSTGEVFAFEDDGSQDHFIQKDYEALPGYMPKRETDDEAKKRPADSIDDAVAEIYARFMRFQAEYTEREAQAHGLLGVRGAVDGQIDDLGGHSTALL